MSTLKILREVERLSLEQVERAAEEIPPPLSEEIEIRFVLLQYMTHELDEGVSS